MNSIPRLLIRALAFLFVAALPARAETETPPPYYFETLAGVSHIGNADGTGKAARFYHPFSVAFDRSGNLWVADTYNHTLRRITPEGAVTTVAGLGGFNGSADGTGSAARFYFPAALALDNVGNVYVADARNHTIRRVTPAGVVTTLAGLAGQPGSADGTGDAARFDTPQGIAVDPSGSIYVADSNNSTIRKITAAGVVTTFAGVASDQGSADGTGNAARFRLPTGLAADATGNVYVADAFNHTIRRLTPAGVVSTVAGLAGSFGSVDGTGNLARFINPQGLALDLAGNLYVADGGGCTIRRIDAAGMVTTLAGLAGSFGWNDGNGSAARFNFPCGLAVSATNTLFIADAYNSTIRSVTLAGAVTTFAGSAESRGAADGTGSAARFNMPAGVAVDAAGQVYIADSSNHTIRRITPAGVVTTLAGQASTSGSADGTGSEARFSSPTGVALDGAGNLLVTDTGNNTIRRITPAGAVTTLAGKAGAFGWADGTGDAARFFDPYGITVDAIGNIYVADSRNEVIRRITSAGVVTTLAGSAGIPGSTDGPAADARFNHPYGLALDSAGNLHVSDMYNHTIRRITPTGAVTTLAGLAGSSGAVDGTGSEARLNRPGGLARDRSGNLYVVDSTNHTFRRITPAGAVTTLAGKPGTDGSADGIGNSARFFFPNFIALDDAGVAYVTDSFNHTIRKGQLASVPVAVSQPQSLSVAAGASAQFSVTAAAVPAPTYQWYHNGSPFNGATSSQLSFTNARSTDAGDYTVVVTNPLGALTSAKATLTVTAAPITASPASGGGTAGGGGAPSTWFLLGLGTLGLAQKLHGGQRACRRSPSAD